ncbi:phosphorylase family protein [Besnoitia besnoiti]|uniref:Phosphorylase family protein n=1 Tax=Besnoitia besnoiti TaxID=94643 RepID=A0A2A9MK51_BESBE|nr:phosphorylase family protein [Besnoitia besnoiti]PFH35782.1 phosphorylase family protein [Besnoitia besnoiti]
MELDSRSSGSSSARRPSSRAAPPFAHVGSSGDQHAVHSVGIVSRDKGSASLSPLSASAARGPAAEHHSSLSLADSRVSPDGSIKIDKRISSGGQSYSRHTRPGADARDGSFVQRRSFGEPSATQSFTDGGSSLGRPSLFNLDNHEEVLSDEKRSVLAEDPSFLAGVDVPVLGRQNTGRTASSSQSKNSLCGTGSGSISRRCRDGTNDLNPNVSESAVGIPFLGVHVEDHSRMPLPNGGTSLGGPRSLDETSSSLGKRNICGNVSGRSRETQTRALENNADLPPSFHDSKANIFSGSTRSNVGSGRYSASTGRLAFDEKFGEREKDERFFRDSMVSAGSTDFMDEKVSRVSSGPGKITRRESYDTSISERDLQWDASGAKHWNSSREIKVDKESLRSGLERRRSTKDESHQFDGEGSTTNRDRGMYPDEAKAVLRDALLLPDGHVYHLGVRRGDVHNRILTVGHAARADLLANTLLEAKRSRLSLTSSRFFKVHSGYYKGAKVSIIAIGMGAPMVELLMREVSYITDGPLAVVRLGTCSLLNPRLRPGCLVVATKGIMGCYNDYTFFDGSMEDGARVKGLSPYVITRPCAPDPELSARIVENVSKAIDDPALLHTGLHVSAENYYACQGRIDNLFNDRNEKLLDQLLSHGVDSMDMESHQLLHLANRRFQPVKAAAAHIGIANRISDQFAHPITPEVLNKQVLLAGRACLDALVSVPL